MEAMIPPTYHPPEPFAAAALQLTAGQGTPLGPGQGQITDASRAEYVRIIEKLAREGCDAVAFGLHRDSPAGHTRDVPAADARLHTLEAGVARRAADLRALNAREPYGFPTAMLASS